MEIKRRDFLRKLSGATALVASGTLYGPQAGTTSTPQTIGSAKQLAATFGNLRERFPIFQQRNQAHPLVYLDSAATAQRPIEVINAIADYYCRVNANPAKTLHSLARQSAEHYEEARRITARFVNASAAEEIVWTRGTTEAINLVASSWGGAHLHSGDEVLLSTAEHYSNLVPWQIASLRTGARLRFVEVDDAGVLRLEHLSALLSERTKLVALSHVSNVLGRINPVRDICERAHCAGATVLIDAAQSVPHFPVDVQELGCDFLAFSGHKMMGPMGIGVLWARREILDGMPPYQSGSNMVHDVDLELAAAHFAEGALKFEAGTPNVAGAVGLAAAVKFIESLNRGELWRREQELTRHALLRLREVAGLRLLGPSDADDRVSVFSFVIDGIPALDVVRALDEEGIAIRGGDLAARPLLNRMGVQVAARASAYIYTQSSEFDALVEALLKLPRKKS
jgi:cysteine desulfurase / selenocysteine lyase